MLRASKPAILARPMSMASAISPGRSSPRPDSADSPKPITPSMIELGRAQFAFHARRPIAGRPRIGQAALDHAAIDFGAQPLDRDPVRPERHVALGVPRLELRRRGGAAGEPGHQILRIVGIDAGAAGEAEPLAERIEPPVDLDLGEAGRAKLQPVDRPGGAVGAKIAADILHRRAAEHHRHRR